MSTRRCPPGFLAGLGLCVLLLAGCDVEENQESQLAGETYHLNGSSSGVLAGFTSVTCAEFPAGSPSFSSPHIKVQIKWGNNAQVGEPSRFGSFLNLYLSPLPDPDRVRRAAVVTASTRDTDDASVTSTVFEFSSVAAEYEYGVPTQTVTSVWLHKLTIPEQTFQHPSDGEITISGSLDGLFMTCY